MIPFFPKQIASKAVYLYLAALGIVSLVFMQYAMSLTFIAIGVMWVVGFFLLSHYCSKGWQSIPEKLFIRRLFWTALLLRWAWVIFSYFFYIAKTGQPFEFAAADALWYYEESTGNRNTPIVDIIRYLFVDAESVSDSGYVFYLSLISKITGTSVLLPRFINSIFSAWTCVLLFQLTKRIVGEEAGRLAAVFSCFMTNLIYYCGLHMKEAMMLLVLVAFLTLLFGWIGVLFVVKSLKNKRTKNTEPQKSFSFWFIYFVLIWSVFMTFDVMKYCLENGMLNHWYSFVFGVVFIFIGWAAGHLGNILPKSNKHR